MEACEYVDAPYLCLSITNFLKTEKLSGQKDQSGGLAPNPAVLEGSINLNFANIQVNYVFLTREEQLFKFFVQYNKHVRLLSLVFKSKNFLKIVDSIILMF